MSYLSKETIEQLRQSVNSSNWPYDIESWPSKIGTVTNCLAYSAGFAIPDYNKNIFIPPEGICVVDYLEYMFNISGLLYRKISSIDDAGKNELIIQVRYNNSGSFHVIRKTPDNIWSHKKGWGNGPTLISNWRMIDALFPIVACTFAVKRKAS